MGAGESQARVLDWVPPAQSTEQADQAENALQPPSTEIEFVVAADLFGFGPPQSYLQ